MREYGINRRKMILESQGSVRLWSSLKVKGFEWFFGAMWKDFIIYVHSFFFF